MNLAAIALLALVFGLLFYDWATLRRRGRRVLLVEAVVFVGGAFFIVFPDAATRAAHLVGIGRGVDFILYPLVIWLVREPLVTLPVARDVQDVGAREAALGEGGGAELGLDLHRHGALEVRQRVGPGARDDPDPHGRGS